MASLRVVGGSDGADKRLNGWKEIATHFGRGVRTVQRWEKELGMPVHRLAGGRNDSVSASVRELDDWWRAQVKADGSPAAGEVEHEGPTARTDEPRAAPSLQGDAPRETPAWHPTPAWHRRNRWAIAAASIVCALALAAGWFWLRHAPNPAAWKLEHGKVHVYAADGRFLWEATTGRLFESGPSAPVPIVLIEDLEGDGTTEVIVGDRGTVASPGHLYCFDARGRQRFDHVVTRVARFGDTDHRGPWGLHLAAVTDIQSRRGKALWAAYNSYNEFPTVLQRLDPANGMAIGEYWSDGNINDVRSFVVDGRTRILVAAANNDFRSAALAVLDPDRPTATAPARQHYFTCSTCPPGRPLDFFVFPTTDIEQKQQSESWPSIIVAPGHGFTVQLAHDASAILKAPGRVGVTYYRFDANLRPVSAEREPVFKIIWDEMSRAKILDHPFGPAEQAGVWPMFRWNGAEFEEIRPR